MGAKETVKKLGGLVSTILLGEAKVTIGKIEESVGRIDKDLDAMRPDLKDVREKVSSMDGKVDKLWEKTFFQAASPLALKEQWKKVVLNSSIKGQIDSHLPECIQQVQKENPKNPLDAQEIIRDKVEELVKEFDLADFINKLYQAGGTKDSIYPIVAIYLMELVIPELKFPETKKD